MFLGGHPHIPPGCGMPFSVGSLETHCVLWSSCNGSSFISDFEFSLSCGESS